MSYINLYLKPAGSKYSDFDVVFSSKLSIAVAYHSDKSTTFPSNKSINVGKWTTMHRNTFPSLYFHMEVEISWASEQCTCNYVHIATSPFIICFRKFVVEKTIMRTACLWACCCASGCLSACLNWELVTLQRRNLIDTTFMLIISTFSVENSRHWNVERTACILCCRFSFYNESVPGNKPFWEHFYQRHD